jgi:glucosamine-6-phosphate deaminase
VPAQAITIGIGTILEARRILLIASGKAKADAVERALRGPATEALPASALQLHKHATVLIDEAAAR